MDKPKPPMQGYKAFDSDMTCRGFQYKVGEESIYDGKIDPCKSGFHFCKNPADCFDYYVYDGSKTVICKVEARGEIKTDDGKKYVTDKLFIAEQIPWEHVHNLVNLGRDCTGLRNSGNRNSGDCNSGDRNSGDCNSGDCNSGNRNSGDWNSGDWNSGDRNSGDWNKTSFSNGVLCTKKPTILIFDKQSNLTLQEWLDTEAHHLMNKIGCMPEFIWASDMTDKEKEEHQEYKILGGYLRPARSRSEAVKEWWGELTDKQKLVIFAIPNFDCEKWCYIMEYDVSEDYKRLMNTEAE
ncbi:MAG: pentapeptide repeat-containing protein [Atopobium minutum]|uniref:pentapeptide repeat-containing protein n=1 Tax=Atopobium minutum TaxID=1381 RepID=UPI002909863D|nr:pentapeptide repeat-containing protein [Atopobium minutum]MDU5356779.1 pentapeptide repeat-containing protein [Atopobium minutum]MDU5892389.1 pentapeptide repeat-containing protein [Atopobium minutum]